ncbi:IS5 family transposase [Solimonas marina]|uniref:IS5 family transposase n=1 Tax=Solimonas marina TaxID=2714601 RepID=A0A969WBV3_9GAMM|nr:IS5 family transposase [Solimonas marina]
MRASLKGIYQREVSGAGGPAPYDPVSMFRLMLLGQWHGLSDGELEKALAVRIDFLVFCGFDVGEALPDATTICRFRNRLADRCLDQKLLRQVNGQLEALGLKVKGTRGAIIDATIIQSAGRPRNTIDATKDGIIEDVSASADREARWVKKGNEAFFGYRGFMAVDTEDGYVEAVRGTPANAAEVTNLEALLDRLPAQAHDAVFADKGYHSKANRALLKARGLQDGIQYKAARNRPLQAWHKQVNALIGLIRYKVERGFGTMKRKFGLHRARYFGLRKTEAQMTYAAINLNLLKAANKIVQMVPIPRPLPQGRCV